MADLGGDKIAKSAVARIVAADADPSGPMMGRGSGKRIQIGQIDGDGAKLAFSATGRILVDGKLAGTGPGKGADSVAIYGAARIAADRGGLFADLPMSSAMRVPPALRARSATPVARRASAAVLRSPAGK